VFIKGHQALESARAIDTVVLDKTGTVTTGRMTVIDLWTAAGVDRAQLLGDTGAVENAAEHAIGRVIAAYALRELGALPRVGQRGRVERAERSRWSRSPVGALPRPGTISSGRATNPRIPAASRAADRALVLCRRKRQFR